MDMVLEVFVAYNEKYIIPPEKLNNESIGVLNNTPGKIIKGQMVVIYHLVFFIS